MKEFFEFLNTPISFLDEKGRKYAFHFIVLCFILGLIFGIQVASRY